MFPRRARFWLQVSSSTWPRPALEFVVVSEMLQDWRTYLMSFKPPRIRKRWRHVAYAPRSFTGPWAGGP